MTARRGAHILYVRAAGRPHPAGDEPVDALDALLEVLSGVTPVVEALPPDAALADVGGSTRYFERDPVEIARLVRVRALARYDLDCTVGVAAGPMLARMAAHDGPPGAVRSVDADPARIADFLRPKPVAALYGVGPRTARTLCDFGLDTVGRLAAAPLPAVQRVLGARLGRVLHERARGVDTAAVVPNAPARSAGAEWRFDRYELDGGRRRRALLSLAVELGLRLRSESRVARSLALTVRYADRSVTTRSRALPEPSAHTPVLAAAAYALHDGLRLQRARVASLALRAEDLAAAGGAAHQLAFDRQGEKARLLEPVVDRIAAQWPGTVVGPAALAPRPRRTA